MNAAWIFAYQYLATDKQAMNELATSKWLLSTA